MHPFLEKYGHWLTSRAHLIELIPAILLREKKTLKEQPKCIRDVSVIFDGTAEALAIVVRSFQEDPYKPTQRLIRLEVLAKAFKGEELAQRLISPFFCANLFYVICFSNNFKFWISLYAFG